MAHVNAGQYVVQPGYPAPHPQHLPQMYQEQQVPGTGYIQVNRNDQYPQYYQQQMVFIQHFFGNLSTKKQANGQFFFIFELKIQTGYLTGFFKDTFKTGR